MPLPSITALKQTRPIAGGLTDGLTTTPPAADTPAPWQETWTAKRDREAAALQPKPAGITVLATSPAPSTPPPFQETWVEKRDRETKAGALQSQSRSIADLTPAPAVPAPSNIISYDSLQKGQQRTGQPSAGFAKGGPVGIIPGKVNHHVADDVTINAKKGEYVIPQEVVSHLGEKFFNTLVKKTRDEIGAPQGTGAKTHVQRDNMGRRDKPGLPSITAGLADGGSIYGTPEELAQRPPLSQQIADVGGKVANAIRSIPGIGYNSEDTTPTAPNAAPVPVPPITMLPSHVPAGTTIARIASPPPASGGAGTKEAAPQTAEKSAVPGIPGVKQFSYDKNAPAGGSTSLPSITDGVLQNKALWEKGTVDNPTTADQPAAIRSIADLPGSASYFDPAGNKHTITQQLNSDGKPMLDNQGKPVTAESSIGWTNSYQGPTALDAAKEGVKARLGYIPVDYEQNRGKYDMALAGQAGAFDANAKGLEGKKIEANNPNRQAEAASHLAQAGYYGAHADYFKAISNPDYLKRQERIASMKDTTAQAREAEKLNLDMAKSWVKGSTGMEHPDHISAAMAYIQKRSDFERDFDGFINKLPDNARSEWVKKFQAGDPQIVAELGKRGIVAPKAPAFNTTAALPGAGGAQ